jgi:hypothetical protein
MSIQMALMVLLSQWFERLTGIEKRMNPLKYR